MWGGGAVVMGYSAPVVSAINRQVGGLSTDDPLCTGASIVDALLRVRDYAAPGSLPIALSRMYKKLCMRVK